MKTNRKRLLKLNCIWLAPNVTPYPKLRENLSSNLKTSKFTDLSLTKNTSKWSNDTRARCREHMRTPSGNSKEDALKSRRTNKESKWRGKGFRGSKIAILASTKTLNN